MPMMRCYSCDGCCSCHISPPCNFCVAHGECRCGAWTCMVDANGEPLCRDCTDKAEEVRDAE
jgi:hypothetical protein